MYFTGFLYLEHHKIPWLFHDQIYIDPWLKVALSDTWPFQKNSNSIKKKLQLNVSLQELKRQGFGVPSP